jgi:hypothetical protein
MASVCRGNRDSRNGLYLYSDLYWGIASLELANRTARVYAEEAKWVNTCNK